MKISVCGKGGSGKSTIVSLLAERLAAAEKEVLIIDSDESNYGLHRHLGMENPKEFTGFFGGKEEVLKDMMLSDFTHQFFEGQWKLDDIPEGYYNDSSYDKSRDRDGQVFVLACFCPEIHNNTMACFCPEIHNNTSKI